MLYGTIRLKKVIIVTNIEYLDICIEILRIKRGAGGGRQKKCEKNSHFAAAAIKHAIK